MSNQATQFKIAEMATRIELARTLTYRACCSADAGKPDTKLVAMATSTIVMINPLRLRRTRTRSSRLISSSIYSVGCSGFKVRGSRFTVQCFQCSINLFNQHPSFFPCISILKFFNFHVSLPGARRVQG
ncbi:MAG: hypothetical protein DRG71_03680 [Deltaproteobacteria bacterium]|nr:MAG: hypothetical protein DRG71_03680 [Deltaproteobacteria bacterium]